MNGAIYRRTGTAFSRQRRRRLVMSFEMVRLISRHPSRFINNCIVKCEKNSRAAVLIQALPGETVA